MEAKPKVVDLPARPGSKAAEAASCALVEKAAESDESLMEIFFANETSQKMN